MTKCIFLINSLDYSDSTRILELNHFDDFLWNNWLKRTGNKYYHHIFNRKVEPILSTNLLTYGDLKGYILY